VTHAHAQALASAHARAACVDVEGVGGAGAMIAVGLSREAAEAAVEATKVRRTRAYRSIPLNGSHCSRQGRVVVACHNSIDGVTMSGVRADVEVLGARLAAAGVFVRPVRD